MGNTCIVLILFWCSFVSVCMNSFEVIRVYYSQYWLVSVLTQSPHLHTYTGRSLLTVTLNTTAQIRHIQARSCPTHCLLIVNIYLQSDGFIFIFSCQITIRLNKLFPSYCGPLWWLGKLRAVTWHNSLPYQLNVIYFYLGSIFELPKEDWKHKNG